MVPADNVSTDLLLEEKEKSTSVSSEECTDIDLQHNTQLEVAAGTPVVLDYLLNHPLTCALQ